MRKIFLAFLVILGISCSKSHISTSKLTTWKFGGSDNGFTLKDNYKNHKAPPGMTLIEGGTFTMGHVQDDVMSDWNTSPRKVQVKTFYMDEAEVTNFEYMFYLQWLEKVFPPSEKAYKHVYEAALPDTLVWEDALGSNEHLSETYLRHPAYANYPVVGVSWLQAVEYCKWRTDRLNEKILIENGILKDPGMLKAKQGANFNTQLYLENPDLLFEGNPKMYTDEVNEVVKKKKQRRHINLADGILMPNFRLPTEAEWEYAAKALIENREYNNLKGRKKYPWNGTHTRNRSKRKHRGDQLANFKLGKGDYSGLAGWSNDGADITNRIKAYPPNAFGLYDMAGNVSEWVYDTYNPITDTQRNDLSYTRGERSLKKQFDAEGKPVVATYNNMEYDTLKNGKIVPKTLPGNIKTVSFVKKRELPNSHENGTAEKFKELRVFKGGSWKDREYWLDPSQRRYLPQEMSANDIGFRCAMDKVGGSNSKKRKYHR